VYCIPNCNASTSCVIGKRLNVTLPSVSTRKCPSLCFLPFKKK